MVVLLLGAGSARATTGHSFAGQFGGQGAGDGQFGEPLGKGPAGVGVLASTGEVFTADLGSGLSSQAPRVQRFSADGAFQSSFAIDQQYNVIGALAVDSSGSGAVYVAVGRNDDGSIGRVVKYSAAGVAAYELDAPLSGTAFNSPFGPTALAVDPVDGTVYVAGTDIATGAPVVARFNGVTGAFLGSFDGSSSPEGTPFCGLLTSLAVDGSQRVYVLDSCRGRVDQFSATGGSGVVVDDGSRGVPSAVAADPVSDEIYVSHPGPVGLQITHFSAGGAGVIYTFDASMVGGVRGMAVSGAGTVYTSDATNAFVERFTRFAGPTVVTGGVSALEARSVVLEGTINPEGVASSYYFEYGTDLTYGQRAPAVGGTGAGSGNAVVPASVALDGLQPNKTYHYRLVGSNAAGQIVGADGEFTTATAPPDVDESVFASTIAPRNARLHGAINTNNSIARWYFEYGTTTDYGSYATKSAYGSAPVEEFLFSSGVDQPVSADIGGLEPGTTYHFRLVALEGFFGGTPLPGEDQTFVTAPAAGGGATGVTAGRAALTGTIDPHGVATSYHFDYGLTSSYGASTPEADGGSGDGELKVSEGVSGLLPETTYHVRVVATSADGVVRYGGDGAFRTARAPGAEVIGPTEVSTGAATLAGDVTTYGVAGSYHFDVWSLNSGYTYASPERAVAGNASAERVTAALTGLPAGETFVVQLTVSSNDAIGVSDLRTFATPEVPTVFPPPPGGDDASAYGCGAPRLDAYGGRPKPGDLITISGQDLGVGGSVVLADQSLKPADWSPSGFKVLVPRDAAGTLALTVNCGRRSNTIAVAVFQEPDSRFAVTGRSVAGSAATLRVRVPSPGKLESSGAGTAAAKVTIKKPGTTSIKVRLTSAAAQSLARSRSHTRRVKVRVRFTPAGGQAASKTVTITFKRKGAR